MRSYDFVLVTAVWFILLITGITAWITQGPSNAVAEIGQQVKLNCTANDTIYNWFLSKDGTGMGELKIVGPGCNIVNAPFGDHYEVESLDAGHICNLIISHITMEQAGVYRCSEPGRSFLSILTVIENSPTITYNTTENVVVENEKVIITCSLNHNGSVARAPTLRPYFYWKELNGQNVNSSYDWTAENTAVSQITVTAERKVIKPYECQVYLLLKPPTTPNYADNVPAANSSVFSPTIEVLFSPDIDYWYIYPQFIAIGGTTCEFQVVRCYAYGNPPPSYEWFDTKEDVSLSNNDTLDLGEINRQYTCVATNTIRNEEYHYSFSSSLLNLSIIQDCRFPRRESTRISVTLVEGCNNETCACSNGHDAFTLMCKADTYPCAAYQWIGPDNSIIDSQLFKNVHINGIYRCTAYFDRASSNYTRGVFFPNGTSEINITECYDDVSNTWSDELTDSNYSDVAIAMCVLFGISFAVNMTILAIWAYSHLRAKQDQFKRTENVPQPDIMEVSNRTSAPSAYEELRRLDEVQLQQSTYEKLEPIPIMNAK